MSKKDKEYVSLSDTLPKIKAILKQKTGLNLSQDVIDLIIRLLINEITYCIASDKQFRLPGIGIFESSVFKEMDYVKSNGQRIYIEPHLIPELKWGRDVKREIRYNPQLVPSLNNILETLLKEMDEFNFKKRPEVEQPIEINPNED